MAPWLQKMTPRAPGYHFDGQIEAFLVSFLLILGDLFGHCPPEARERLQLVTLVPKLMRFGLLQIRFQSNRAQMASKPRGHHRTISAFEANA